MSNEPRGLTLDLVRHLVGFLPTTTLVELSKGPLRDLRPEDPGYADGGDCRTCNALSGLAESKPSEIANSANALLDWHDCTESSFETLKLIALATSDGEFQRKLTDEMYEVFGALAYARCLVIYQAAGAALTERGVLP